MSQSSPPPSVTATSAPPSVQSSYEPLAPRSEGLPLAPQPQSPPPPPPIQAQQPYSSPSNPRKRKAPDPEPMTQTPAAPLSGYGLSAGYASQAQQAEPQSDIIPQGSAQKKSRTNTPWSQAEEQRLKTMREAGNSWNEIAKTFPNRTEGSVKKHWYKDMHYADFAEDESAALLAAIKEYEANKWKVIGTKVGKPAKACEQYAKENFAGRI